VHLEGAVNLNAPREKVWKFLTDADFVAQCAPGVKEMEIVIPEKKFRAVAAVGFGSITTEFNTDIEFLELDPVERVKVKAHGKAPGSAVDATSEIFLSDGPDGTTDLKWTAEIAIMGTIASLASRLMGPVTKKLSGVFFECVKSKIEG
jgi:carbon monoxide dehydrogenase subunit G